MEIFMYRLEDKFLYKINPSRVIGTLTKSGTKMWDTKTVLSTLTLRM